MADRVNSLLADLKRCAADMLCIACGHRIGGDGGSLVCGDRLMIDAADVLQEYVDRCARYADEIMTLREERQWIPVTERLPALGERVLAARDGLFVGEAYLSESGAWRRYYGALWVLLGCAPVTHWMPLPDAPRGKELSCRDDA